MSGEGDYGMASLLTIHEGRTDVKPEQVGLDSARLEMLDQHFGAN